MRIIYRKWKLNYQVVYSRLRPAHTQHNTHYMVLKLNTLLTTHYKVLKRNTGYSLGTTVPKADVDNYNAHSNIISSVHIPCIVSACTSI